MRFSRPRHDFTPLKQTDKKLKTWNNRHCDHLARPQSARMIVDAGVVSLIKNVRQQTVLLQRATVYTRRDGFLPIPLFSSSCFAIHKRYPVEQRPKNNMINLIFINCTRPRRTTREDVYHRRCNQLYSSSRRAPVIMNIILLGVVL